MELIFQCVLRLLSRDYHSNPSGPSATKSVNALSFHLPQYGQFLALDKWDASFMRAGWAACLDWFRHWDICFVLCVVCLLDWWEDWGWRVMNWWQEGHWLQTTGPIIKASEMPRVHGDWYYQRKSRLWGQRIDLQLNQASWFWTVNHAAGDEKKKVFRWWSFLHPLLKTMSFIFIKVPSFVATVYQNYICAFGIFGRF